MSGKRVDGPLRGIVKRTRAPTWPYGNRITRELECGHAQREPHGSKSKWATHAHCKACGPQQLKGTAA